MHDRQHPVLLDSPNRNYAAAPFRATVQIPRLPVTTWRLGCICPKGTGRTQPW